MFGMRSKDNPEAEMGFFEHLEVLRWHILRSLVAIGICASVAGYFYDFVFDKIILAAQHKEFPTYRLLCWASEKLHTSKDLCVDHDLRIPLQNTAMFGQVTLLIEYSLILGIILAFPYVIWELWRFVAPALKETEAKKTSRVILACSVFFFIGIAFCYFLLIPFSINFAINFSINPGIKNNFTIENYIDFFTTLMLAMGAVFELPMVVYFLSRLGILKGSTMRKGRRYAILIIVIIAAVITPSPDVFSQCLVAAPIYLLYELSIFIAVRNERRMQKS